MCAKGHLFAMKAGRARPNQRASVLHQALAEYRAVIDRYASDPNPGFQVWVAKAMVDAAQVFGGDVVNDKAMAIVYCDLGIAFSCARTPPSSPGVSRLPRASTAVSSLRSWVSPPTPCQ